MKKLRVMIVDDEVTIREGFKRLFDWQRYGCELAAEAGDGAEAVRLADMCRPDIMIVDINLSVLSGLEVVKIIKTRPYKPAFIIVSGYDDFYFCQEALRLQVAEYLLKPVDFSEIGKVIERLKTRSLLKKAEDKAADEELPMLLQISGYLKEHLSEEITLQKLSEVFHLNPNYISKWFKENAGINYSSYLTQLRIEEAKSLLVSTPKTIAEIADVVGFKDYRVFTKVFKEWEGLSPSVYRKG